MSSGKYLVHQATGGVFSPRSPVPYSFLKAWPSTPLPYRVWLPYFLLTGWLLAGWLAGWWLAGWPGWLAGWAWLAGWLAVNIIWMAGIWWMWAPGFMGMNLPLFWPRFDLVLDLVLDLVQVPLKFVSWLYQRKTMNMKCLPRIRGVPTSFYKLNMMFSTNQGTPQDYSSLHQIKTVAEMGPREKGKGPLVSIFTDNWRLRVGSWLWGPARVLIHCMLSN